MVTRRRLIKNIAAASLTVPFLPALSFAATAGAQDRKFILIILRGALDGLAAVPAIGDPDYASQRGELAFAPHETLKLNGLFSLNPALKNLHHMYQSGDANIIHAVASPYRDRSHFDGQDVLENGQAASLTGQTGWLGRLLPATENIGQNAIALSNGVPLILRGSQNSTSWAPSRLPRIDDDLIARLKYLYQNDDTLFQSLEQAVMADRIAASAMMGDKNRGFRQKLSISANHAAQFLKTNQSLNIAVLEGFGWDTHVRQGTVNGSLAYTLKDLDDSLGLFKEKLGPIWKQTAIAVVTEFGRTVRANGNGGTDHGTAGVAFLCGGAIAGGRVLTDWPGLKTTNLYQERDIYPTMDIRALFKGILRDHLQISSDIIETKLFSNSSNISPLNGIIS